MADKSIPVVMYHHISPLHRELNVTPEIFEGHLRALSRKGWKTLSGEEFLYFMQRNKVPPKTVLLTFDDGFADNYVYAYPLLKKYGMKAMLFIATGLIEDREVKRDSFVALSHNPAWELAFTERRSEVMCTWNELKEMEGSKAFDIQSHGVSHKIPQFIREKKYTEINKDLFLGKKVLEEKLSKKIFHLAWPQGGYDEKTIDIATGLGYKALYTTERGANTASNLTAIRRLPVKLRGGNWLTGKLNIYSSVFLTKIYLVIRTGI